MGEKVRRRWAAGEAMALGWGGLTAVAEATGLSRPTMRAGLAEVQGGVLHAEEADQTATHRVRRGGGGRRRVTENDRTLLKDWPSFWASSTRGDPQSPLLWTSKSTRHLAEALVPQGHHVSHDTVARLLDDLHSSLQANRHTKEGSAQGDREAPCAPITTQVRAFQKRGHPGVSVDTKKKAWIGDCKKAGRAWPPQGQPAQGRSQDGVDKRLGKGIP